MFFPENLEYYPYLHMIINTIERLKIKMQSFNLVTRGGLLNNDLGCHLSFLHAPHRRTLDCVSRVPTTRSITPPVYESLEKCERRAEIEQCKKEEQSIRVLLSEQNISTQRIQNNRGIACAIRTKNTGFEELDKKAQIMMTSTPELRDRKDAKGKMHNIQRRQDAGELWDDDRDEGGAQRPKEANSSHEGRPESAGDEIGGNGASYIQKR